MLTIKLSLLSLACGLAAASRTGAAARDTAIISEAGDLGAIVNGNGPDCVQIGKSITCDGGANAVAVASGGEDAVSVASAGTGAGKDAVAGTGAGASGVKTSDGLICSRVGDILTCTTEDGSASASTSGGPGFTCVKIKNGIKCGKNGGQDDNDDDADDADDVDDADFDDEE